MESNFKENYIREQKEQAAARQARLAKIGMSPDNVGGSAAPAPARTSHTAGTAGRQRESVAQNPQRPRPTPVRPASIQKSGNSNQNTMQSAPRKAYDSMS